MVFWIYVYGVDDGLSCETSKFAADTNIASKVSTTLNEEALQSDLDRSARWASQWLMEFKVDKCTVLHIGNTNSAFNAW